MSTVVASLVRAGRAPRRLRDDLHRVTTPLGASAVASLGRTARIGARIPPSILGEELANAMGDALRRALRFWDDSAMDETVSERAVERRNGAFVGRSEKHGARGGSLPLPIGRERTRRPGLATRAPTSPSERGAFPPLAGFGRTRAVPSNASVNDERPGRVKGSPLPPLVRESRETNDSLATAVTPSAEARAASPLVAVLRAYWSAEQRGSPRTGSAAESEQRNGAAQAVRENGTPASPPARAHRDGSRPTAAATERDRDHSFSTDARPALATPLGARWLPSAIHPAAAPELSRPPLPTQPVPDWLHGDFADELADILREQAIDHGVDLT